jgi:hypothetical protein
MVISIFRVPVVPSLCYFSGRRLRASSILPSLVVVFLSSPGSLGSVRRGSLGSIHRSSLGSVCRALHALPFTGSRPYLLI